MRDFLQVISIGVSCLQRQLIHIVVLASFPLWGSTSFASVNSQDGDHISFNWTCSIAAQLELVSSETWQEAKMTWQGFGELQCWRTNHFQDSMHNYFSDRLRVVYKADGFESLDPEHFELKLMTLFVPTKHPMSLMRSFQTELKIAEDRDFFDLKPDLVVTVSAADLPKSAYFKVSIKRANASSQTNNNPYVDFVQPDENEINALNKLYDLFSSGELSFQPLRETQNKLVDI